MRSSIKYWRALLNDIFVYLRDRVFRRRPLAILLYHSIGSDGEPFTVTMADFERQLAFLKKHDFCVLTLAEVAAYMDGRLNLQRKSVALTFDDGYLNNFDIVPLLEKYGFPITIFLGIDFIEHGRTNKRGVKFDMLDWDKILDMHRSGLVDFQPHTVTHPRLSRLSREEIIREIQDSKRIIDEKLGKKCRYFAYPFGDHDPATADVVRGQVDLAVTVQKGFVGRDCDRARLPRNSVHRLVDMLRFRLIV